MIFLNFFKERRTEEIAGQGEVGLAATWAFAEEVITFGWMLKLLASETLGKGRALVKKFDGNMHLQDVSEDDKFGNERMRNIG